MQHLTINPSAQFLNATLGSVNNSITIQVGDSISEDCESYSAQYIQQPGFVSLPSKPQAGKPTAELINLKGASYDYIIGGRDVASQQAYGNLGYGETILYAPGIDGTSQARLSLKSNSSITLSTTDDGTPTGNNMMLQLTPDGLFFTAPWGKFTFDMAGFRVSNAAGASMALMSTSDPTTGNSIMMSAGSVTINSGMIMLGTPITTAVPLPVVYGVLPVVAPGIPILGEGVGAVVVNAAASTSVFVGF